MTKGRKRTAFRYEGKRVWFADGRYFIVENGQTVTLPYMYQVSLAKKENEQNH